MSAYSWSSCSCLPHHTTDGIPILLAMLCSGLAAQWLKLFLELFGTGRFNFRLLTQTGGMPSSHSALMTAMAVGVGLAQGFESSTFAVALGITLVVMYDAAGLRRAAGRMAGILNQITDDIYSHHPDKVPERLRELLGHTPVEVLVGSALGALVAVLFYSM